MTLNSKPNGWTAGQWFLLRGLTSLYLIVALALIATARSPHPVATIMASLGILLSAIRITGYRDRVLAALLVVVTLYLRTYFLSFLGLPLISLILLYHATLPQNGILALRPAKFNVPDFEWHISQRSFFALRSFAALIFTVLAIGIWVKKGFSGIALAPNLPGVQELDYTINILLTVALSVTALLCVITPARAALWWLEAFAILLGIILTFGGILAFPVILLALHVLDPRWFQGQTEGSREIIFYDGTCGLCHNWVLFVLAEERLGQSFDFAPIGSGEFKAAVGATSVSDSIIVRSAEGALLQKSKAVLHILEKVGGLWSVFAALGKFVPLALRDRTYDFVAKHRRKLFPAPSDICPLVPPHLRERFKF